LRHLQWPLPRRRGDRPSPDHGGRAHVGRRAIAKALERLADGQDVSGHLIEVHRLENEAGRLVRAALAALFMDGIDPMTVIRSPVAVRTAGKPELIRVWSRSSPLASAPRRTLSSRAG
jgi:hypothetical protein